MSPAHDCLGVWELLENVLLNLSATDLTRVMRVSRTWKQLTQESKHLRENLVVAPLAVSLPPTEKLYDWADSIPAYASEASLRINPAINRGRLHLYPSGKEVTEIIFCSSANKPLCAKKHEFATFPPCQKMLLEAGFGSHTCTIRVENGIRIRHILWATDSMLATERLYGGDAQKHYVPRAFAMFNDCALSGYLEELGGDEETELEEG